MTTVAANPPAIADADAKHLRVLQALVVFFVAIRIAYVFFAGPSFDESYYWLWGQHPDLSYYDHAPFHAWLLGLSDAVFGRSLFGLRWMTLATLAGTVYLFRVWTRRYGGAEWRTLFWSGLVIYLASPTFGVFSSIAFHDYLLIFLLYVSAHFFLTYFTAYLEKGRGRTLDLYIAGVVLGAAGLTKYNGVFLGLGVAALVLTYKPLRPLLRNPHLWIIGIIAALMQLPVLIWNYQHDFVSFGFHFSGRHSQSWLSQINIWTIIEFFAGAIFLMSPFYVPAFIRFFWSRPANVFENNGRLLAIWMFCLSSGVFFAISLTDSSWWWWNLAAYIIAIPFLAKHMGRGWLFFGHVVYGAIVGLHFLISSTVFPWFTLVGLQDNWRVNLYGWEQLEAPVDAAVEKYKPDFIASEGREFASILAFTLDNPDVRALTAQPFQFQYWWNKEDYRGENAVVVLDRERPLYTIEGLFTTITPIVEIPVVRFGIELNRYRLYYAEGYKPQP